MKTKTTGTIAIILALLLLVSVAYYVGWFEALGFAPEEAVEQTALEQEVAEATIEQAACPETYLTNVTINVMNSEDTTAATEMAAGLYYYKIVDGVAETDAFTSISDSSAAGVNLPCGEDWEARMLFANTYEDGENSYIEDVNGDSSALASNGNIYFTTSGSAITLTATGSQNGVLEFQVWDELNNAYLNENGATDSTTYQDTPASFESNTDTSALAVGTQGQVELTINYRTNETKRDFDDRGYYIAVNASSSVYDTPTVRVDGETLTNIKGSLDEYCTRSYSGEEYVYFSERDVPSNDKGQLYFSIFALAGVDPAAGDDLSITWNPIGTYTSITGSGVLKIGACKDDATTTDVGTDQRVDVNVS